MQLFSADATMFLRIFQILLFAPENRKKTPSKVAHTNFFRNLFKGRPNPGFRSVKVQTETFLKKDSRDFKNSFYLGFLP
jgi:hypothetical protein